MQPLWKTWRFLKKLKVEFLEDPAILFLDKYPEKTIIQNDTCTPMFITALFIVAKTWKQPNYPLEEEWIKKTWCVCVCVCVCVYTHHGILVSHKKWNNAICSCMDEPEIITRSEVRQKEKGKCYMISGKYHMILYHMVSQIP